MWPALQAIAHAPWSRDQHVASLPSDGVIEHLAIIAARTPPRERREDKAAQAEEETEPAQGKGGAPGDTRLLKRPCANPWSSTEHARHLVRLPKDGVIEHRAIIAAQAPPRKRRKEKTAQAEEARAEWSTLPTSSASDEATPLLGGIRQGNGAAVSAKVKRP